MPGGIAVATRGKFGLHVTGQSQSIYSTPAGYGPGNRHDEEGHPVGWPSSLMPG